MLNRRAVLLIVFILSVHFILVLCCIKANAPTCDEIAHHVASGYSYLVTKDFRMNPSNPPLIREISALPLLFLNLKAPTHLQSWMDGDTSVFGRQFFYELNKNADMIIFWARMPIAILSVSLGLLIFFWSYSLYGYEGGILSLVLYSLSPNIIAHASLATVDLGTALFIFASLFTFSIFLKAPTLKNSILAGICFGLALASKYTSIFLVPIFVLLAVIFYYSERSKFKKLLINRLIVGALGIIFVGGLVLFGSYFFEIKPLIKSAPDIPEKIEYIKVFSQKMGLERLGLSKERAVWIAQNVPMPFSEYLVGLAGVMHQNAVGGFYNTFLLGKTCYNGFWNYFLVAFAVKSTFPTLILFAIALILAFMSGKKNMWGNTFLIVPIVFFFFLVSHSKAQVGIRHILQIYPLIFVLIGSLCMIPVKRIFKHTFLAVVTIWQLASLMAAFPHPIAYFNELSGGPDNGYNILRDSNLDWGQGLKALKPYMDNNGIDSIRLHYFGTADPYYYKIAFSPMEAQDFKAPGKGFYAISVQFLDDVAWTKQFKPIAKVAHSIFIYKF